MAPRDWPDQDVEPERRLGRLLVRRLDLSPPVDIRDVVSRYADVEADLIPADCDAVVVGLNGDRPRPLIVLARDKPHRRQRFSLAHELGHVLIPWHTGTTSICHVEGRATGDWEYRQGEAQANRFASEVLLPHRWLTTAVDPNNLRDTMRTAEGANVSAAATCLAVTRYLEPGHVVVLSRDGSIDLVTSSPGTAARLPRLGARFEPHLLSAFATRYEVVPFGGREVHSWFFEASAVPTSGPDDARTSLDVLDQILGERCLEADRLGARRSILGIAGAAKGSYGATTVAQLHAILRMRFASHPEHAMVTSHPDFATFLEWRSHELLAPK